MKKASPSLESQVADLERRIHDLKRGHETSHHTAQLTRLEKEVTVLRRKAYGKLSAWGRVQLARHPQRPLALDYINRIFGEFTELHGDRLFGEDQAVVAGFGFLRGGAVAVIGQQKGRDTQENIRRNFGMSHPEGYRKALRVMKLAEKFNRPVVTLIDTNGAYPGIGAEERGQSEAIARNLLEMGRLRVPIVACILGEGGSGGALGIGVANRVLMMENAWYSVISPEGCAAILWNNREMVKQASEVLKLTARDLLAFKVVDEVIPEPVGGAHLDHEEAARNLKRSLERNLLPLLRLSPAALEEQRYRRFRNLGQMQTRRKGEND